MIKAIRERARIVRILLFLSVNNGPLTSIAAIEVEDMEVDAPQPTELGKRQPKKKIAQPLANSKGAGGQRSSPSSPPLAILWSPS